MNRLPQAYHSQKFLVVDDRDAYLSLIRFTLAELRMPDNIATFHTSTEGLVERLRIAPVAFLLLDCHMPTSGLAVLRDIRSDEKIGDLPVVMMSDAPTPELLRECYRSGANAFVAKPARATEMGPWLQRLLEFWIGHNISPYGRP